MDARELRAALAERGVVPAAELRQSLGVSPATLSRLVAAAGAEVLRLGRGRSTSYALARALPGLPGRIPIHRVDEAGRPALVGDLIQLQDGGTWLESRGESGRALEGLPPFVHDMAPSGYLGRHFAEQHPDLELPRRLQDWSDAHRLVSVARRGEDCPGDLILGEESMQRWLDRDDTESAPHDYPVLASGSASGGAGSSAGGEQPKFTAMVGGCSVLVKFTPGDGSPTDHRWRDLLVCEGLALDTLRGEGIPAPKWRIHDVGGRRFLEVERFDRIGARGRRNVMTLGAIDDEHFGHRDDWTRAAHRLRDARMLSAAETETVVLLDAFGACIANSDRHFGNLAFHADAMDAHPKLRLAPVYDMLPMALAPNAGEVPGAPAAPAPRALWVPCWERAGEIASVYWRRVAEDDRISAEMHAIAEEVVPTLLA